MTPPGGLRRLLASTAILLTTACGFPPPVTDGYITDKRLEPAHVETRTDTDWDCWYGRHDSSSYTKTYECGWRDVEVHDHIPDTWYLDLRNDAGDEGSVAVSKDVFDSVEVGQHYPDLH